MSTRADVRAWLGHEAADHARTCGVCGGDWSGLWVGVSDLHICPQCAVEILPRLIADAVWYPRLALPEAERALEHVSKEFWRAIAIQALRARDAQ